MKQLIITSFLLFICISGHADPLKQRIAEMDIDLQIRANEDPSFDRFLQQEAKQKRLEKKAAISSKARKLREENRYEKARKAYAIQHRKQMAKEEAQQKAFRKQYIKNRNLKVKQETKKRKHFAKMEVKRRKQERNRQKQLIAKMQERLSRMPASSATVRRKRIPIEKRTKLYEKILEEKRNQK